MSSVKHKKRLPRCLKAICSPQITRPYPLPPILSNYDVKAALRPLCSEYCIAIIETNDKLSKVEKKESASYLGVGSSRVAATRIELVTQGL